MGHDYGLPVHQFISPTKRLTMRTAITLAAWVYIASNYDYHWSIIFPFLITLYFAVEEDRKA